VQITRKSFQHALDTCKHVTLCPGGQAELLYCSDIFCKKQPAVNLCTRHKGFCRIAVENGAAVVPVINYGEVFQLRNALTWRWLQRLTYRLIGFPIPYLLLGYWGLPLSRRSPAWLVVGEPVWPDESKSGAEAVDDLHRRFYESVQRLWETTKSQAPGYERHRLVFDSQY
jgi:diacylglycerol O-acyltransferase 2, plant